MTRHARWLIALVVVSGIVALGQSESPPSNPWQSVSKAVAVLHATEGNSVSGTITFTQMEDGLHVTAEVKGLTTNAQHGFHVHEYGDCSCADAMCAGGHYDPRKTGHHALPGDEAAHHAGDLGNLQADADGNAHYEATFADLSIAGNVNPILGRAVIVHEKADDGGQPTGNAGARLACGVIGIAKP